MTKKVTIDPVSRTSLRLELLRQGVSLGTATGFAVGRAGRNFLITNWHVVTGTNPDTNEVQGIPDELRIIHHAAKGLGRWMLCWESLFDEEGTPRWLEHPKGREVDVIIFPLTSLAEVVVYPLALSLANSDALVSVAQPVSIVGYPFGLTSGGAWPIWKTGHIASDPDVDYDGRPVFLIDATTRGGMSGSPVIYRAYGSYRTRDAMVTVGGSVTKFLGVYAGRIHGQAEIGRVWRPHVIEEIFQAHGL